MSTWLVQGLAASAGITITETGGAVLIDKYGGSADVRCFIPLSSMLRRAL